MSEVRPGAPTAGASAPSESAPGASALGRPASAPDASLSGVRLGVDVGSVRVGVAVSDPSGLLASPLVTLARDAAHSTDLSELATLAAEHGAVEVVVGLPRSLSGRDGPAARIARVYAADLAARLDVPVALADERLTTVLASRTLADRGVRGRRQRAVVDQAAAVAILQSWLDGRRAAGRGERGAASR